MPWGHNWRHWALLGIGGDEFFFDLLFYRLTWRCYVVIKLKGGKLSRINFSLKPEELEAYLNEYVVKQEDAKSILATKVCTHFNRIKHELRIKRRQDSTEVGRIKNNIILIGPTGVGKTYLIRSAADLIGVPFVKADATKFSETGYVGADVEDLVRDLVLGVAAETAATSLSRAKRITSG